MSEINLEEFSELRANIMGAVLMSNISIEDAAPIVIGTWLKMMNEISGEEYELVKKETK